ncbi:MAG TPA: ABC transporter permease subunit [Candidatus Eisenbergiella merdipullorum]|uniref:ABC transporter permease subunit n=1 Tax=Candidatus Eisenbergiella merdipullorum TaxID=2838553 RepID=A0A9D2L060_9FIRM|nr:ABC transporter permease subunit [Candidatus Eisenbergiella merdipullorum]
MFLVQGIICEVALALAVNELIYKKWGKFFQSCMILPTFISYVAVTYIVSALLDGDNSLINTILQSFDLKPIRFYLEAKYWPMILLLVNVWKQTGYGSVLYLASLSGIDREIYESAEVDGATRWQKIFHINIPLLAPMICIRMLLSLGGIMNSDTGMFYQVTKNVGALYPTTQVLDSYVMNAMTSGTDFSMTSAVTFFQSMVGLVLTIVVNKIVKRFSPESALF